MRTPALLALAALAACAHVSHTADPTAWIELESQNFTLRTDVPEPEARVTIARLEEVRAALYAASWHAREQQPGRVFALELRDDAELEEFARRGLLGFVASTAFGERMMVMTAQQSPWDLPVLKHELAHLIDDEFLLRQPRWLSEGLAAFLETLRIDERGVAVVGEPSVDRLLYLRTHRPMDTARVFTMGSEMFSLPEGEGYAFESSAWLLVHWLINDHRAQLDAFLVRMALADDPAQAFWRIFPDLDSDKIGAALALYARAGQYQKGSRAFPRPDVRATVRRLSAAEMHAIRADLLRLSMGLPPRPGEAAAEARVALRLDPGNPLAQRIAGDGDAEQSTRAHPDDWRAWVLLAGKKKDLARASLRRALELAPGNAEVMSQLAWEEGRAGDLARALELARQAVARAPGHPVVLDAWAGMLAQTGECDAAAQAEHRAIDALPDNAPRELAVELHGRLQAMESGCRARTAKLVEPKLVDCDGAGPLAAGAAGDVTVAFVIGADGRVSGVEGQRGSPQAVAAVARWLATCRYAPAQRGDQAVPASATQEFHFTRVRAPGGKSGKKGN